MYPLALNIGIQRRICCTNWTKPTVTPRGRIRGFQKLIYQQRVGQTLERACIDGRKMRINYCCGAGILRHLPGVTSELGAQHADMATELLRRSDPAQVLIDSPLHEMQLHIGQ